jgi:hypothetical protein
MATIIKAVRVIKYDVFDLVVGFSGGMNYGNSIVTGIYEGCTEGKEKYVIVYFENGMQTTLFNFDEVIHCPEEYDYKDYYSKECSKEINDILDGLKRKLNKKSANNGQ